MIEHDTDVLIVGAGAAALVTALNVKKRRVCVLWPGADDEPRTASDIAQGGIAAAVGADDSPALHLRDTLRAGCHHNVQSVARRVCEEAPAVVTYLSSLGVGFEQVSDRPALHMEAAHSRARVLHVGGAATGSAIMQALRRHTATASHVDRLPRMRAVALLRNANGVCGIAAVTEGGQPLVVNARDVVIATGGVGGLYSRSTNPLDACGDGPAIALAAGARCADLEFVQFHPTALDVDARPLPLMTEALRGAGARLVDDGGTDFMRNVHPLGELAPRDVVARAVYAVQASGGRVWLDATRLCGASVAEAFPSIYSTCHAYGIDATREPIPVTPAAHYHMGGIDVDVDGRTSLPRLFAVGEAACTGLHGANRLASNSLLEAVVSGRRVARTLDYVAMERPRGMLRSGSAAGYEQPDVSLHRELGQIMWRCMGLMRNAEGLAEGLAQISQLRELTPPGATLQRSRLALAKQMIRAAMRRRMSCGAHHRSDTGVQLERVRPLAR